MSENLLISCRSELSKSSGSAKATVNRCRTSAGGLFFLALVYFGLQYQFIRTIPLYDVHRQGDQLTCCQQSFDDRCCVEFAVVGDVDGEALETQGQSGVGEVPGGEVGVRALIERAEPAAQRAKLAPERRR